MANDPHRSAFERLKEYYDHEELVCPDCGFEDEGGSWASETDGNVIEYSHECPSCGALREHTVDLSEE